ncbi:MAG: zinc ribbon domain-containing protein [Phycisphaeraceae bacterium]|nr:zinc ribbon domain-containing protein [Phycisphaeraceae bacterium]
MPTYEYICRKCEHEFDVFQSMTEAPKRKCPKCGKNALERKIGLGAAILFKGSGFYQTDYRSESYKKAAEAEKPAKAEAKSESKSEAKPEPKPAKESKKSDAKPKAAKKE